MKSPHMLLAANNVRKLQANLLSVLDPAGNAAIDLEITANTRQLLALSRDHYSFATTAARPSWRQQTSRLYYSAYHASRAVRLHVSGAYSTDAIDHKNIGQLPEDFPELNTYANRLQVLRDDRNLADYDHTAQEADLVILRSEAVALVGSFLNHVTAYLRARGVTP